MIPTTTEAAARLGAHLPPAVPLSRAAGRLVAGLARHGHEVKVSLAALLAPLAQASVDEWSGYLPWPRGWLAVSLPDAASHELFETVTQEYALRKLSLARAAGVLQSFGLAAVPARATRNAFELSAVPVACEDTPLLAGDGAQDRILAGCLVIDMGRLVAAPLAARILEELGARVIRIRPPGFATHAAGEMTIDLGAEDGRRALAEVAAGADLLIENCSASAGERLTRLLHDRPPCRRVSVRGFCGHSHRRHWKAFGFMIEAARGCGFAPHADAYRPVRSSRIPVLDRAAGLIAATHAVDALLRGRGGDESCHRTVSLDAVALRIVAQERRAA